MWLERCVICHESTNTLIRVEDNDTLKSNALNILEMHEEIPNELEAHMGSASNVLWTSSCLLTRILYIDTWQIVMYSINNPCVKYSDSLSSRHCIKSLRIARNCYQNLTWFFTKMLLSAAYSIEIISNMTSKYPQCYSNRQQPCHFTLASLTAI